MGCYCYLFQKIAIYNDKRQKTDNVSCYNWRINDEIITDSLSSFHFLKVKCICFLWFIFILFYSWNNIHQSLTVCFPAKNSNISQYCHKLVISRTFFFTILGIWLFATGHPLMLSILILFKTGMDFLRQTWEKRFRNSWFYFDIG